MSPQAQYQKKFSFEFFPPRSAEAERVLLESQAKLAALQPDYFSITYGAGGSARGQTLESAVSIKQSTSIPVAPHLSCINSSKDEISGVLDQYRELEFTHLVVIRGDLPPDGKNIGEFKYASDLVTFIRETTGDFFSIDVACYPEFHPESPSVEVEFENFKRKVDAGANGAITQYFYNPYAYYEFINSCERQNISIPVVPGIMPITNCEQLVRFSERCGAEIPQWILRRLENYGDNLEAIGDFGLEVVTEICQSLLDFGAPGLHIYSMNRHVTCEKIWRNLGLVE